MIDKASLRMSSKVKYSVLFVCHGNICRSPIAEAVFDDLARKAGVRDQWLIDSAATSTEELGNPIYPKSQEILRKHSIKYSHKARQIEKSDFDKYKLILGFDQANLRNLERMKPASSAAEVHLINFFNPVRRNQPVEDPWYPDTLEAFENVYQDCYNSCKEILEKYK